VTWWVLWAAWIVLFVLSYPQTDLVVQTIRGPVSFHIGLPSWAFAGLMFCLGVSFACGMASTTFKYVAEDFPDNMGAVSGIVGLAGGLGGFLLPILWGIPLDTTGVCSSCFMLLYAALWDYLGVTNPGVYHRGPSDTNKRRANRGKELTGSD
jgi:MFS transporter, NNP family, nitrate/nitrite transporter